MKEDKETCFDCPDMLEEYKKAAEAYKIPYDEDGYIDTEMVYEELDAVAKMIYAEINWYCEEVMIMSMFINLSEEIAKSAIIWQQAG